MQRTADINTKTAAAVCFKEQIDLSLQSNNVEIVLVLTKINDAAQNTEDLQKNQIASDTCKGNDR